MRRRWTTDVVGRRIFKANSITFFCRTASFVGLAPPSSTFACSFPSPLLFHPFVWFLQFLLVRCVFLRFSLFLILFFSFSFYSEFANELRLKTKITCKARKCQRKRDRGGEEKTKGAGGTLPEKVYFIFDIFSQEN